MWLHFSVAWSFMSTVFPPPVSTVPSRASGEGTCKRRELRPTSTLGRKYWFGCRRRNCRVERDVRWEVSGATYGTESWHHLRQSRTDCSAWAHAGRPRRWNVAGQPECVATLQREKTEVKLSACCILEAVTSGQGVLASTAASWQASSWEDPAGGPTAEFCLCVCVHVQVLGWFSSWAAVIERTVWYHCRLPLQFTALWNQMFDWQSGPNSTYSWWTSVVWCLRPVDCSNDPGLWQLVQQ